MAEYRMETGAFWQIYTGPDAGTALLALKDYQKALIRRNTSGGPDHEQMITELRLFALAHYLGDTNLAEIAFKSYSSSLNEIRQARGADPTNLPPREALLSLEMLERNFQIGWKTNTNALLQLPPSESEVEAYAGRFGARRE